MAGSAFALSGSAAVSAAGGDSAPVGGTRHSQAFRLWLQPAFPAPPFCRESLRWWRRELRAERIFRLPRWRPEPFPWADRAGWFCGSAALWIAARTNRGRSVRARAAYPRRGRSGRLAPAIASPVFRVRGRGGPAPPPRPVPIQMPADFSSQKMRRIQPPSRKLVRKSRLMKQSAR